MKLCECGCGQPAPIAQRSSPRRRHVKGEHVRYIAGHSQRGIAGPASGNWKGGRSVTNGYRTIRRPQHARAHPNGYVYEHLLVAEEALGKALPPGAQVHHVNGDTLDNRGSNLVICHDQAYHRLLHRRARALVAQ